MPDISVIICTHNPREDYLLRVLDGLRAQNLPLAQWELLLIDNASEKPLADRFDLSWHPQSRHVREEKVGLTHARLRGITDARGELLVFVDDDNILKPDYLAAGLAIGLNHPWLGAWNGSCLPEFEVEPPAEIRPWLQCLAIHKITAPVWAKLRVYTEACPCGAGVFVRRELALNYQKLVSRDPVRQALGRSGKSLGAGEDMDMVLSGFDLGLGVGRFPELSLTHLIGARRLTAEYIEGVLDGFGYSEVVLGVVHQPGYSSPIQNCRRILLSKILLLGKGPVQRRLQVASQKGSLRAYQELKKLGYF